MAAREIKTTLALDGEKQFKAGMDEAYRAMKVLGSEMKLNTATFAENASGIESLNAKAKTLTSIQEQQAKIVEALTRAVEESAQAYGESDKRTDAYRVKLNNAKASLANIENQLERTNTDIDNFGKQADDAGTKTTDWKTKLESLGAQLDKSIGLLGKITAGVAAVGTAVVAAGKQLFDLTAETGKWADELITTSVQTGISTTALQEWGYAAQFIDTEVDTITGSMARMVRQLASAKEGTGQSAEAFAALGVSITDSSGQLLNSQDIFFATIDALGRVANETERDALAMQIFGRSAQELNPLIQAGSEHLRALGAEAQAMGIIMGEDGVAKLGAFDDKMNVLNSTIGGIKNVIAVALTPAMERIIEVVQQVANKFTEWLNSPAAQTLIGTLTDKIVNLASNIGDNLDGVLNSITGAFQSAGDVIGFVIDNIGTITTVVITLTGVLTTLKVAQIAVNLAMSSNPIGAVITVIGLLVTAIVALIQNWDNVKAAINNAWESIKKAFTDGVRAIGEFVGDIMGRFRDLITGAWDAGRNLVNGLWEGIQSASAWLWEKISGWIGGIWTDIKSFFGISSPSKLMAETIGKPMVQGVALGIAKNAGLIDKAMAGLVPSDVQSNVSMDVTRRFSDISGGSARSKNVLTDAVREAMGELVIVLNDRELGRAVRGYA